MLAASAVFSFGEVTVKCPEPGAWKIDLKREVAADGAEIAKLTLDCEKEATPPKFSLAAAVPQIGMDYKWSVNCSDGHMPANWCGSMRSHFASGMPLYVYYNNRDESTFSLAASECDHALKNVGGIREEGSLLEMEFAYFQSAEAPIRHYETQVRFDARRQPFAEAVRAAAKWIETAGGYTPARTPEAALEPLYSSWYSFHQNVFDKDIEAECAIAAKMGMKTLIVDDGWQTDDTNRGYAFCGDWRVSPRRFPDFAAHVKRVQAMGIKYMIWYSVPFVGFKSANYERFKGKYLRIDQGQGAAVLDPRFPEVREFLVGTYVKAMKEWGLDGFKLDFIDSIYFSGEDPAVKENYAGRDIKSVPLAVNRLMREVKAALTAINPEVLIEFRQSYVGPGVRQCGNMLRVGDCPGNAQRNRVAIANLRLASGETAVHSDMLEWNFQEAPAESAKYIINAIFGVVQYSVMLREAPPEHLAMIGKWIRFSQDHRETLLKGRFTPHHPELGYPWIEAEGESERIIGVYSDSLVIDIPDDGKKLIFMNASGRDYVTIRRGGKVEVIKVASGDFAIYLAKVCN